MTGYYECVDCGQEFPEMFLVLFKLPRAMTGDDHNGNGDEL
ncbi:MAG: hypothetical protein ACFFD4_25660 [Candidatus Odinarchaeota archaeon]